MLLYCERQLSQHTKNNGKRRQLAFFGNQSHNGHFSHMINNTTYAVLDTSATIHTGLFVKNSDTNREVYGEDNYANNYGVQSLIYTAPQSRLAFVDPVDAYAQMGYSNNTINIKRLIALNFLDYVHRYGQILSKFFSNQQEGTSTTYNCVNAPEHKVIWNQASSKKHPGRYQPAPSTEEKELETQASLKHQEDIQPRRRQNGGVWFMPRH